MDKNLRPLSPAIGARMTKSLVLLALVLSAVGLGSLGPGSARTMLVADQKPEPVERIEGPDDWTPVADALGSGPGGLNGRLKDAFSTRFAGSWLDHTVVPSVLRVAVARSVEGDDSALDAMAGPFANRLSVVGVRYSLKELNAFRAIVDEEVRRLGLEYGLGLDESSNAVRVELAEDSPDLRQIVAARGVPVDAFSIRPGFSSPVPTHATRQTSPDYEGGLQLSIQ